jgi:DNA-directed RNA polymerase delta subunit
VQATLGDDMFIALSETEWGVRETVAFELNNAGSMAMRSNSIEAELEAAGL